MLSALAGVAAASVVTAGLPATMRAVVVDSPPCTRPNFTCLEVSSSHKTPRPGPGFAIVKVNSSSINPSDLDMAVAAGRLLGVLGIDFAGEVVETGADCPSLSVGDLVWGCGKGSYAEYTIALCAATGPVPSNLPMNIAGTIPEVGMTGVEALTKCGAPWDPTRNLTVVITSGSGGTGFVGIQLARAFGAGTIVTAATGGDNIALVKSLGADIVVDYKVENIFDALQNDTVDVVYDNYGAVGSADRAMPKMRAGGVYLLLPGGEKGSLSKHPRPGVRQIDFGDMIPNRTALMTLKQLFESGTLSPHVQASFSLDRIREAFSLSNSGTVVGKLAIVP